MPDFNPQPFNPAQHSPVPPPRGPLDAGSEIVIRTMASDLESIAKGGGLAQVEKITFHPSAASSREAAATPTNSSIATRAYKSPSPPAEAKSDLWIWILAIVAGVGFLGLVGYTIYRFLGK